MSESLLDATSGLGWAVATLLLLMSVASWSMALWKSWILWRASKDMPRAREAFWQAPGLSEGVSALRQRERCPLLGPMAQAVAAQAAAAGWAGDPAAQRTRVLREALQAGQRRLQSGQVWLATIGATAPFVGLLGTVWGIYEALTGIANASQLSIDRVAGPVGEALVMTAAGLAVALPAVVAYNLLGRVIQRLSQDLEGFAHDLQGL